ncbi:MraY family glycosyltransferase [Proteiniphilum acetatigenes]|uniref:MraY family glycosyltransferase n=1 Tax=Proteiniphilum acetatigenes TaxID=294710 RepID=UPI00037FFE18|nr:MraY family glycosyltransferase [Proteiniphilum acetatigenes]SFL31774.1 UDP-N-acetylmuramyl pentapeptide phosphotransferase/UDP-N-acetylglucosamine-1-phosphate transferase [Porphyromonadaceae bacterium KH3CP3RA]
MELYISLIAALIGSGLFSWFFLPEIQRICFEKNLFDSHDDRKVHDGIVPRLGGVGFFPAMILSFLLVVSVNILLHTSIISSIHQSSLVEWTLVLSAIIFLYLTGIADDLIDVRYRSKLLIQVIAAVLFIASGVWVNNLHGLFGMYEISPILGIPLTLFIIVSIINAFNFIDGIDGLAAGIAMLAFLFFGFTFLYLQLYIYSILAFAALGMLVPFFYYNIFGKASNHSKIFMGDCGSLTIGMLLSVFAVKVYHFVSVGSDQSPQALVLGFSVLIVPLFDGLRVVLFRLFKRRNPFKPDRSHMHHQLLDLGFSHRVATLIMLTNVIFFGGITVLLVSFLDINLLLGGIILLWIFLDFFLRRGVKRAARAASLQNKITVEQVGQIKSDQLF